MKIALFQMTSGTNRADNTADLCTAIHEAAGMGTDMLFAPEMSGLVDRDRTRAVASLSPEQERAQIQALCAAAKTASIWVHIGSIPCGLEGGNGDGRYANRSFIIDDTGEIRATYDKMHLFDVVLPSGESWRESAAYAPGEAPVAVDTPWGKLGLSICYDVRFSGLYAAYAQSGVSMIAVPSAFTVSTGAAHWHMLLRARAIETQSFVIAAAQSGTHADGRKTYGHSLVVDPWGEVLLDMGDAPAGLGYATLDMDTLAQVRTAIPVRANRRDIPAVRMV